MANVLTPMTRLAAALLLAALLAACGDDGQPASEARSPRDVRFFLAHPGERDAKIAACGADIRDAASDTECRNARAAALESLPTAKPNGAVRDVPFYLAHPGEMTAKLAACRDNPGGTVLGAECLNARAASIRLATDPSNKTMPKIDWNF